MLRIETLSVFPEMFEPVMSTSILGRARAAGALEFVAHDLRNWTHDKHRTTDDEPYGGGPGQLMKPEPVFEALDKLCATDAPAVPDTPDTLVKCNAHGAPGAPDLPGTPGPLDAGGPTNGPTNSLTIFFTPHGTPFTQALAQKLAEQQRLIMVCGRYEGFDERVYTRADLCVSLGDYVLTGGELAAMVVSDAVCRLLPGVLGHELSNVEESFAGGLLEYPQYTRPASYRGLEVPEVLLSGNHAAIAQWRREMSIIKTAAVRPDLLENADLTKQERAGLKHPKD